MSVESLNIFIRSVLVGELCYNRSSDTYSFNRMSNSPEAQRVIDKLLLDCGSDGIKVGLQDRFAPPERVNIDELLAMLGMSSYDLWEIIKRTKGVCVVDPIWFSEDYNITWFWRYHPIGRYHFNGRYRPNGRCVPRFKFLKSEVPTIMISDDERRRELRRYKYSIVKEDIFM